MYGRRDRKGDGGEESQGFFVNEKKCIVDKLGFLPLCVSVCVCVRVSASWVNTLCTCMVGVGGGRERGKGRKML